MSRPPLPPPEVPPAWGAVVLRDFTADDLAMVQDLATDPYVPRTGSLPADADVAQALAWVRRQRGRAASGVGWSFCVADRLTGAALGQVGLWPFADDPEQASAGYAVAPRSRGRGVAAAGLRAVTAFAWTRPALRRVELAIEPWNTASRRIAEHAGYRCERFAPAYREVGGVPADMTVYVATRPGTNG